MSDSFCIVPQTWRHVCPQVRDLTIVASLGKPYVKIMIPRDLVVQGAGKDNTYLRGVFKAQCGFRCEPMITLAPTKGVLEVYGNGWVYIHNTVNVAAGNTDVFHYKLVLNGETSLEAMVNITFTA